MRKPVVFSSISLLFYLKSHFQLTACSKRYYLCWFSTAMLIFEKGIIIYLTTQSFLPTGAVVSLLYLSSIKSKWPHPLLRWLRGSHADGLKADLQALRRLPVWKTDHLMPADMRITFEYLLPMCSLCILHSNKHKREERRLAYHAVNKDAVTLNTHAQNWMCVS